MLLGHAAIVLPFSDSPYPILAWCLAGFAVVVIGIAKSGFGSGVGIVAVPMFVLAFENPENNNATAQALGALLPLLIAADTLSVWHHWGTWDRKNLKVLAPGTIVGVLIGIAILYYLMGMPTLWWQSGYNPHALIVDEARQEAAQGQLKFTIGLICLLYVIADRVKSRFAPEFRFQATYLSGTVAGTSAGIVTAIAHAAGPVATIYLLGQHLAKQRFIGTAVIYFFAVNLFKVPFYVLLGQINPTTLWAGLWLVPLVPLGTWLGTRLNRIMSEVVFRWTILVIVAITGLQFVSGVGLMEILAATGLK